MVASSGDRRPSPPLEWEGVLKRERYSAAVLAKRDAIADAGKAYDWQVLIERLERTPALVNSWRVGGTAWYAPLHQAAHGGAPANVVERLLELGAWRRLATAARELPVDIARDRGHHELVALLEPRVTREVAAGVLQAMQDQFHEVIRGRIASIKDAEGMRLPELGPLTEYASASCWFAVPGMYGGFKFWLADAREPTLVAESWCRVVEGSGQRHEITPSGARLIDCGFV
jgi:hypothetical protein